MSDRRFPVDPHAPPAIAGPPARWRMPNRRLTTRRLAEWQGIPFAIDFGWDAAGVVREVFVSRDPAVLGKAMATGSTMSGLLEGACIDISLLLQEGHRAADLERRYPGPRETHYPQQMFDESPPQRAIALLAMQAEAEEGETIRADYAAIAGGRLVDPASLPRGSGEGAP